MDLLFEFETDINKAFRDNIEALIEIRDNSIHYFNSDNELSKIVLELGTASLKNYLNIIKDWFNIDLSKYNFYLMPLSFFHGFEMINSSSINSKNKQLTNLKDYFNNKVSKTESNPENKYNLILNVETKFVKSLLSTELKVKTLRSKDDSETPNLVQEIILTEEDKSKKYPYTYKILFNKLKSRYTNFLANDIFKKHMKEVKQDTNLTYQRLSNYLNPNSQITYFYSTGVLEYFDKIYTKK